MSETVKAYNEYAQNYEQRWASYLQHTHNAFLKHLNFSETDRVLDLSCGTGLLACEIREQGKGFDQLILNDPSSNMLDIARNRLSNHGNIDFSNAPAHRLPFEDHSFNRVLSLNAFHNYEHQLQVISEISRVLQPGGSFYVLDWNRSGFFRMVNTLIRWVVPEHIDTRSSDECRQMLSKKGFLIETEEVWNYKYWKFFYLQAHLELTE